MTQPLGSTAIVGAGAVGSFYGAMLARAGHGVTLIGRAPHVQAVSERGLRLHMNGQIHTVSLAVPRPRPTRTVIWPPAPIWRRLAALTWFCSA